MWWYILTYPAQIIGYLRIALICVAFCYVNTNPTISYTLDEVDGRVAKLLGQTTNFGAVFDQCIDRSGTAALCLALILVDNDNFLIYLSFIFLDIVSHFIFMNAALLLKLDSHKTVKNWFLKIYYHRQFNMLICAQEFVGYLLIYLFIKSEFLFPTWFNIFIFLGFIFKHLSNIVQIYEGSKMIIDFETSSVKQ